MSLFRTSIAIGDPSDLPSYTPERTSTWSASLRCVVIALCPGRRRSSSCWIAPGSTASPGGRPSTSTPTAGPCDSPNVVTRNRRPKVEDTLPALRALGALGECRGDTLRGAHRRSSRAIRARLLRRRLRRGHRLLAIRLVGQHQLLELEQVRGPDVGARVGDQRLDPLPGDDVLAGVVEEQLGMERTAIDDGGEHLPVRRGHAEPAVLVDVGEIARLDVGPGRGLELAHHPLARAAQLGLAPHLVEVEQQLGVGIRGLGHGGLHSSERSSGRGYQSRRLAYSGFHSGTRPGVHGAPAASALSPSACSVSRAPLRSVMTPVSAAETISYACWCDVVGALVDCQLPSTTLPMRSESDGGVGSLWDATSSSPFSRIEIARSRSSSLEASTRSAAAAAAGVSSSAFFS